MTIFQKTRILAQVLTWTLAAPFAMRRGPTDAFARYCPTLVGTPTASPKDLIALADRVLLARVFGRLLFRTRCYKRTLVLYRLLRTHGHPAVAYVGFDREPEPDRLAGHAWLSLRGTRIDDPTFTPRRDFTPFLEIAETARSVADGEPVPDRNPVRDGGPLTNGRPNADARS